MSNSINIKDWKTYKISNMFDVSYGKFIPRCDSESNGVPHITTTTMNNGVGYFVKNAMFPAGCITVASDGNMGASYYQEKPYSASNIVSSLIPKNKIVLNKYTAEFICSLLRKIGANYSWEGYKFSVQRVKDTMLPLPSIRKINPDFARLNTIIGGGIDMSKIDTSSWKEFKLADIAKLENGNKLDIGKMTQLSPSINFVSRTAKNNGVSSIVDKIEGIEPYPAGCLTLAFGGSVGSCFLQEKPFYTGQNVGVIMFSEEISLEAKRYIATSLGNKCKLSYQAFGNEINRHFKTDLSVKLPAIETYEPDWQYMEEYMKNIESEVTLKIDKFQTILDNEKHKIDTQK